MKEQKRRRYLVHGKESESGFIVEILCTNKELYYGFQALSCI